MSFENLLLWNTIEKEAIKALEIDLWITMWFARRLQSI